MDLATLRVAANKIFTAELPANDLTIVWHASEPLTVPRKWYESAFSLLADHCPPSIKITHNFQTNGVLINNEWVDFFRHPNVRVGVSLDGPSWLHDRHRRTRDARGTYKRVMRGIELLKAADLPFHIICVLTRESLNYPNEIFDFFKEINPIQLCFNIEEIESANKQSSLAINPTDTEQAYRSFMKQTLHRVKQAGQSLLTGKEVSESNMRIREIDEILMALRHPTYGQLEGNSQNLRGHILSIAWNGYFATFSPELLGQKLPTGEDLSLGNILTDPLPPDSDNINYVRQWTSIQTGIKNCKAECGFFNLCLGGAPSNKLGEKASFECTETLFCKLTKKVMINIVLDELDSTLPPNNSETKA